MATAMNAYPALASKNVGGIRVIVCDPDDEVRAAIRVIVEDDPLLVIVGEARDWSSCERDVEDLVPELLIVRAGLIPSEWTNGTAQDTFSPILIRLGEAAGLHQEHAKLGLSLPLDRSAARRALDRAISEVYDRKAKQLLYLVGRYVAASNTAPAFPSVIAVEHEGENRQVRIDTIMAVVAARKSVVLHTANGKSTLRQPIYQVADKLDPSLFLRIHRSVIVNSNHVDRSALTEKSSSLVLHDGSRYPIGRNYRHVLASLIQREH